MPERPAVVDVRRSRERFETRLDWMRGRHSFSFGPHYDPANTHFGVLLSFNDLTVEPGAGFTTHEHQEMEIVTWVLEGTLVHEDSTGHQGVLHPGVVQCMTAGTGVWHSETNDSWRVLGGPPHDEPVRFVQMWVATDEVGRDPGYGQADVTAALEAGGLVPVASGLAPAAGDSADGATRIHNRQAALHAARLRPGDSVLLPAAPYVHLYVARGLVDLEGAGRLETGDAARITASQARRVSGVEREPAGTPGGLAEVLVWEMHAGLG